MAVLNILYSNIFSSISQKQAITNYFNNFIGINVSYGTGNNAIQLRAKIQPAYKHTAHPNQHRNNLEVNMIKIVNFTTFILLFKQNK